MDELSIIDLNCDMGESFGAWQMGNDAEIMKVVSSINIACGFHAGDPSTIRKTIDSGLESGVAIGCHPSYPDLQGFGRRSMAMSPQEIYDFVSYQIAAVLGLCRAAGGVLRHVKPHGALYNQAAKDRVLARAIAKAVSGIDSNLIVYGLSGSFLISEAKEMGLRTFNEVFADRTYQDDGSLTPRSLDDALISDTATAVAQVIQMALNGKVTSLNGVDVLINAETVCIHGDGNRALDFAQNIRGSLIENGITIQAPA